MERDEEQQHKKASLWWQNSIIDMRPGKICFRGQPIEDLMETKSFSQMIFFMILGRNISVEEARLFEMAMVMSVDHGPHAPSIAIARMAATCGIEMNNVLASAVNVLGDNHGGAGQGCAELFYAIEKNIQGGMELSKSVAHTIAMYQEQHGKIIPGFGHRFHTPTDPRSVKVLEVIKRYAEEGHIKGIFGEIAREVQDYINTNSSRAIPMNVDGALAVIFCELGIPAPLCRGLFCISRSVGILAHAWEEMNSGIKNKGPIPPEILPHYIPGGIQEEVQDDK